MPQATAAPGKSLLNPKDHTLILIDHQSQMAFATKSIDAITLRNNAGLVASAAASFGISTVVTSVAEEFVFLLHAGKLRQSICSPHEVLPPRSIASR